MNSFFFRSSMKLSTRFVFRFCRYWRCYLLLLFASMLSFVLIFLSQNDPKLENYFPYFGAGSKFYNFYANGGIEKMRDLMDSNQLDYEFLFTNTKFCLSKSKSGSEERLNNLIEEDLEVLNGFQSLDESSNQTHSSPNMPTEEPTSSLDFIFLVISEAAHFKHRNALRSTWAKLLPKFNSKLLFFIGNPLFNLTMRNVHREGSNLVYIADHSRVVKLSFSFEDKMKLEAEMKDHGDIVQIDMNDHENFTSAKTLVAVRWALTFCTEARQMFILSDLAVLNLKQFEKLSKTRLLPSTDDNLGVLKGHCSYSDEKFALALKLFFNEIFKNKKQPNSAMSAARKLFLSQAEANSKEKDASSPVDNSTPPNTSSTVATGYQGQYCSSLGWILDHTAAKRLWSTSLRTPFMMKLSPAYLTGYLVFKSRIKVDVDAFQSLDSPAKQNCLEAFEKNTDILLCPENFNISSRYSSYIATWNLGQKFVIN